MAERIQRIVFAGGGTGGHVYPALSVAEELRRRRPAAEIVFVGGRRGLENRLVPRAGFPLRSLPLSGYKGAALPARIVAAAAAAAGTLRCAASMLARRPDLVVGVGGYASAPAVLAGLLVRTRVMLMEQNHFPGTVNRRLAGRVDAVCVPSEAARARLGGIGLVTGNPVRDAFHAIAPPPGGERLSLLVFGGSRGARSINRAMVEALPALAAMAPSPRIVHQTGVDDAQEVARAYARHPELSDAEVLAFVDDMPRRFEAADLAVCRAGATTLAELAAAGRPAILVPYPHAADDHQRHNAEAVRDAGAATLIRDAELTGASLAGAILAAWRDPEARRAMARAARTLAVPDAAARIADVAEALVDGKEVPRVP